MIQKLQQLGDQRFDGLDSCATDEQHDHGDGKRCQVLLELQVSVGSDEGKRVAASARSFPFLVLDQPASPTVVTSCPTISAARSAGRDSSSRMRIGKERDSGLFEDAYRSLAVNRRKLLQERLQRIAFFEVVEQVLDRNPRAGEYRCSALNVGIDDDQGLFHARLHRGKVRSRVYREGALDVDGIPRKTLAMSHKLAP